MSCFFDDWSFRLQRFFFSERVLFALSGDRFVYKGKFGGFLCGLKYVDFGRKQWAFCVTQIVFPNEENKESGTALASELRSYILARGARECLVLFSPAGWPKDAFLLQRDGVIWDTLGT